MAMDYSALFQNMPQLSQLANVQLARPVAQPQPQHRPMYPFYAADPLFVSHIQQQQQQQQQHQSLSDPQLAMPVPRPPESKTRLARDEVDLLEKEFNKNPKPSSQRKREIAELLKVENPRINNWFQNRRAKAKQMLRREQDVRLADESASETPPEDQDDCPVSEYYSSSNHSQPLQASSAAFPSVDSAQINYFAAAHDDSAKSSTSPSPEEYPSPKSLVFPPAHDLAVYASAMDGFLTSDASPVHSDALDSEHVLHDFQSLDVFAPFAALGMEPTMASMAYHSELMGVDGVDDVAHLDDDSLAALHCESLHGLSGATHIQQLSSPISSHSPPSASLSDLRFKSPPPPANIATRRNKGAPAMLNATALRTNPYGPKTGVDLAKRMDVPNPIRRIASATGIMANRIHKPSLSQPPRSPLYFERNKDVLIQSLQTATTAAASNGVSPVSPEASLPFQQHQHPHQHQHQQGASDDDSHFALGAAMQHPYFHTEPATLKTPPGTPGFLSAAHADPRGSVDHSWSFVSQQDDVLMTPSLGSFGSEEFPGLAGGAPSYVVHSQPPTPSFGQPAGSGAGYFPAPLPAGTIGQADYSFPGESYMMAGSSARSSPGRPKGKQFQFTPNVTPEDFYSVDK